MGMCGRGRRQAVGVGHGLWIRPGFGSFAPGAGEPPGGGHIGRTGRRLQTRTLETQRERLTTVLEECESICVGYSGGVDSVFLAAHAVRVLGRDRVLAVTGRSAAYPAVQHRMALECVERFGIPHLEIDTRELEDPAYAANPTNRCYHCKTELWSRLAVVARKRGLRTVVDGSNADDLTDHRPGARAAAEWSVRSPLQEAEIGKDEVRALSRRMGLPTWDQPASPCLASRLVYGLPVTPARLEQVESAETLLRQAGLRELRVRHHGDSARIEVAPEELPAATRVVPSLAAPIRALGFERALLDVEGYRRGALNEGLVHLDGRGPAGGQAPEGGAAGIAEVRRLLTDAGLRAPSTAAGKDEDIAAVRAAPSLRSRLAELAPRIRALGFRYVALDPVLDDNRDEET